MRAVERQLGRDGARLGRDGAKHGQLDRQLASERHGQQRLHYTGMYIKGGSRAFSLGIIKTKFFFNNTDLSIFRPSSLSQY